MFGLVLLAIWYAVSGHRSLEFAHHVFFAMMVAFSVVQYLRLRRLPDRKVEIDEQSIRLYPAGFWAVDVIPRRLILGKRDEGSELFVHFNDAGTERAMLFEETLIGKKRWAEFTGLLRDPADQVPAIPAGPRMRPA
ncbi:hypothetical protein OJ996_11435 [Luteolibacter sp. GHJ8]|uniref:PH domain-containing protein n=1 Tax=Luteolibacter rhizosphaerae TaxID=2989719 RepID=A0ABT3G3W6_9BACT|nr:hypothetical protein [Luteolibacter rhizosphaerae]MCW1914191.1 hypothetical protein [Luteolibacter rhizosphaerae]